jgi:choline kinase
LKRELDAWEAVDAGLALCDAEVADVAERSLAAGEQSWNAVKRRWLGEGGEIEAVDLEGLFWIDVDTPADRRPRGGRPAKGYSGLLPGDLGVA